MNNKNKYLTWIKIKASFLRIAPDTMKWKILKKQDIVGIMVCKKRNIK